MQARAAAVAEARSRADEQIRQARAALTRDVAQSKASLQTESERLASEIIASVLRQVGATPLPAGGGE
jgi:vacuolar-type H+-ATPase subunit H